MSTLSSIVPLWQVALAAAVAFVAALLALVLARRYLKAVPYQIVIIAVVVGVSLIVWRLVCNVTPLNDDQVPGISPNDVLCPVVTYVFLGLYAAFQRPIDMARWEQTRVLLTLISFVVNVLVI